REPVFALERVHVLPARDDHVVDAALDPQVAVGVEAAEVARVVPAVADRTRLRLRAVPVAGEGLVGGECTADLALDDSKPRVEGRAAGAARLCALVRADRVGVDLGGRGVVEK